MDDDFLAENVLPAINPDCTSVTTAVDQFNSMTDDYIDNALSSVVSQNSTEITLNAANQHVELTSKFFNNAQFSDIRLRVGTNVYHAHKFILAKSSDVFATLLYSEHWTSVDSEILLEEQDECQGDVFEK